MSLPVSSVCSRSDAGPPQPVPPPGVGSLMAEANCLHFLRALFTVTQSQLAPEADINTCRRRKINLFPSPFLSRDVTCHLYHRLNLSSTNTDSESQLDATHEAQASCVCVKCDNSFKSERGMTVRLRRGDDNNNKKKLQWLLSLAGETPALRQSARSNGC